MILWMLFPARLVIDLLIINHWRWESCQTKEWYDVASSSLWCSTETIHEETNWGYTHLITIGFHFGEKEIEVTVWSVWFLSDSLSNHNYSRERWKNHIHGRPLNLTSFRHFSRASDCWLCSSSPCWLSLHRHSPRGRSYAVCWIIQRPLSSSLRMGGKRR